MNNLGETWNYYITMSPQYVYYWNE